MTNTLKNKFSIIFSHKNNQIATKGLQNGPITILSPCALVLGEVKWKFSVRVFHRMPWQWLITLILKINYKISIETLLQCMEHKQRGMHFRSRNACQHSILNKITLKWYLLCQNKFMNMFFRFISKVPCWRFGLTQTRRKWTEPIFWYRICVRKNFTC